MFYPWLLTSMEQANEQKHTREAGDSILMLRVYDDFQQALFCWDGTWQQDTGWSSQLLSRSHAWLSSTAWPC